MDAAELSPEDVVYYLAASADGYIAGPDGDVSWLGDYFIPELGFHDFIAHVGTAILGRGTWDKMQSFGKWPYGTIPGIVATSRPLGATDAPVAAKAGSAQDILEAARSAGPGPYWLVGGADLATRFAEAGLLTRIDLFVIPVLLGDGIPAFRNKSQMTLDLIGTQTYPKGIIRTSYRPRLAGTPENV